MKTVKTTLAILLTLALVATFAVTAFADTPADLNGHTFKAYQIFKGTQATTDEPIGLADVEWGTGVNPDALLAALENDGSFPGIDASSTAKDVAAVLKEITEFDAELAVKFSKLAYGAKTDICTTVVDKQTNLDPGYYLIVDETSPSTDAENFVFNRALLQMTKNGTFDINVKAEYPTLTKKVKDKNDTTGQESGWQDSADYDIGDNIPYQVTVTLPDMTWYDTYAITINDTLCEALTVNARTVIVKCGDTDLTDDFNITVGSQSIVATCDNIKAFVSNGAVITLEYTAKLGENAKIGAEGNENTANLVYSNNPNDSSKTGKTPDDLVRVFTYQLVLHKVDNSTPAKPLAGAVFTLYKSENGQWVEKGALTVSGDPAATHTWTGLDDGDYKVVETTVPKGYNKLADKYFTVSAGHDETSADPQLTALNCDAMPNQPETIDATIDLNAGTIDSTIVNESGVVLPETGADGTQMLYVLGSALLLGGLVLIVTKKRVGEQF